VGKIADLRSTPPRFPPRSNMVNSSQFFPSFFPGSLRVPLLLGGEDHMSITSKIVSLSPFFFFFFFSLFFFYTPPSFCLLRDSKRHSGVFYNCWEINLETFLSPLKPFSSMSPPPLTISIAVAPVPFLVFDLPKHRVNYFSTVFSAYPVSSTTSCFHGIIQNESTWPAVRHPISFRPITPPG